MSDGERGLYPDGTAMSQFIKDHIPEISQYNHNYYLGHERTRGGQSVRDLLLEVIGSDEDWSEWYLILGERSVLLGESAAFDEDAELFGEDK